MVEPFYTADQVTLFHGHCLEVFPSVADASVDAVVTDPPYALEFMGREWDRFTPDAFEEFCTDWAAECLRVLKPGGHLLAFGGTRTWHRLAAGIEDAGFEIRDTITWMYGSGFPKSLDVSKAIDKAGGTSPADQANVLSTARERNGMTREALAAAVGCTPSSIRDWEEGRARTAGRAVEHIIPSAEYRQKLADLLGYTSDERVVVGVGGVSRTLYESGHRGVAYGDPATAEASRWRGWGTALKPASEPIVVARKPLEGTVVSNVLAYGTGALNINATRVNPGLLTTGGGGWAAPKVDVTAGWNWPYVNGVGGTEGHIAGRWPTNVVLSHAELDGVDLCGDGCVPGCPVAELDRQSGTAAGAHGLSRGPSTKQHGTVYGVYAERAQHGHGDTGGASRFFPTFRYEAKAPTAERPRGDDGTAHPTVKPLELMRWLVQLVTPPGGRILDPFAGSGTTGEACVIEGFACTLIEREAVHLPLIVQRLSKPLQPTLFGGAA